MDFPALEVVDGRARAMVDIENNMIAAEALNGVMIPASYYLVDGMVAREITVPANVMIAGAEHRREHVSVFVGDITVMTADRTERMTGMRTMVSAAGVKRIGYTHAETKWITFHAVPPGMTDIGEIEEYVCVDPSKLQTRRALT